MTVRSPDGPPSASRPVVLQACNLQRGQRSRRVVGEDGPVELCPVEYELLRARMARAGEVLSRAQLEVCLRSLGRMTRRDAVPVPIHHLRRKIGRHRIRTVRGAGCLVPIDRVGW